MAFNRYTLILILLFPCTVISQEKEKTCTVTYVANEGFLISAGDNKILIDALFGGIIGNWCDQPGDSVISLMLGGKAPFDNVDAVLVTHKHTDHFKAGMAIDFLKNNSSSVMICPPQVRDLLKSAPGFGMVSSRIITFNTSLHPDTSINIKGMQVHTMLFRHGSYFITDSVTGVKDDIHRNVENLCYEIRTGGFAVFHGGDLSASDRSPFEAFDFKAKEFDIAFLDRIFMGREGQELMNSYIRANNIVFMHIDPGKAEYYKNILRDFPQFYVFSEPMEEKEFGK